MTPYIWATLFIIFSFPAFSVEEYLWRDGEQKRKVYLKQNLIAHFGQIKTGPEDKLQEKIGNVAIYRTTQERVAQAISQKSAAPNQSPLFSDGPDGTGTVRALPGGVIVTFKQLLSDNEVQSWAQKYQFTLERKINISGETVWLIKTKAGLDSLNQADRLAQNEDVKYASPNWWTPAKVRSLDLSNKNNHTRPVIRETFDSKAQLIQSVTPTNSK